MDELIDKYRVWVEKVVKNLQCSKGQEGNILLSRFQKLQLREDTMGALYHASKLCKVIGRFSDEKRTLKWSQKLERDCQMWKSLFASSIKAVEVDQEAVLNALVESEIDVEEAVSLT